MLTALSVARVRDHCRRGRPGRRRTGGQPGRICVLALLILLALAACTPQANVAATPTPAPVASRSASPTSLVLAPTLTPPASATPAPSVSQTVSAVPTTTTSSSAAIYLAAPALPSAT